MERLGKVPNLPLAFGRKDIIDPDLSTPHQGRTRRASLRALNTKIGTPRAADLGSLIAAQRQAIVV